jgi:hypothetical protein
VDARRSASSNAGCGAHQLLTHEFNGFGDGCGTRSGELEAGTYLSGDNPKHSYGIGRAIELGGHVQHFQKSHLVEREGGGSLGRVFLQGEAQEGSGGGFGMNGIDDDDVPAIGDEIDEVGAEGSAVGELNVIGQGPILEGFDDTHADALVFHEDVADAYDQSWFHGLTYGRRGGRAMR